VPLWRLAFGEPPFAFLGKTTQLDATRLAAELSSRQLVERVDDQVGAHA